LTFNYCSRDLKILSYCLTTSILFFYPCSLTSWALWFWMHIFSLRESYYYEQLSSSSLVFSKELQRALFLAFNVTIYLRTAFSSLADILFFSVS
jgi:hypothetical protein